MNCPIELLESRRMLSVGINRYGGLTVKGTPGNDQIVLQRDLRQSNRYAIIVNGVTRLIDAGSVSDISVYGGNGDDTIRISDLGGEFSVDTTVYGAAGNDRLVCGRYGLT